MSAVAPIPGPKPSMGRIVRFLDGEANEFPAMITRVNPAGEGMPETVHLTAFNTFGGTYALRFVAFSADPKERERWHWPERE